VSRPSAGPPAIPAPRGERPPLGEILRIAGSVTLYCALGGAILGATYVATDRYQEVARAAAEHRSITQLLDLGPDAQVVEIRQYLDPVHDQVVYRAAPKGAETGTQLTFALSGQLLGRARAGLRGGEAEEGLKPLGRIFVALQADTTTGFVIEGETRGYKNVVRFFVALDAAFDVLGVRVIEHEEDPGLGAEIATPWFQAQYFGRTAGQVSTLDVTRDPLPEDWRAALLELQRLPPAQWRSRYGGLLAREGARPIYAVTGATISSRALTMGVRNTVNRFRYRWSLVSPLLEETR
jgi:electron transport complex protein RnfG